MEYNAEEETKSYNVHRKTGDYIIGEVLTNQTTSLERFNIIALERFNGSFMRSHYLEQFLKFSGCNSSSLKSHRLYQLMQFNALQCWGCYQKTYQSWDLVIHISF